MRNLRWIAALALGAAAPAAAQSPAPLIVTADWLRQHAADPNLVLLHVGSRPGYDSLHIPGARYITLADIAVDSLPRVLELPPPAWFDSVLAVRGISDNSRIIIYTGADWYTPTARTYLTLVWAGLGDRTSVLDGGMAAWRAAGGRVTSDATPAPTRAGLTLHPRSDVVVTADWVNARLGRRDIHLVDGREERFYRGAYPPRDGDPRPGHIPGAYSLPFSSMVDSTGHFRPASRLRELFAAAGATASDTVVTYCHIGQQASLVWFGARLAGFTARLYDGSYTYWSQSSQYPVERP